MPSKKNKGDPKEEEPLKPLGFYAKDRLELTKQLFSCLKKKQIKSRLPVNLQKKSIERIQQVCLDEMLGISTKRLLSIINNTICPDNTDSEDSDIEHISLSEISSDSDIEENEKESPGQPKKSTEAVPPKKTEKEMTMLELLELQARARAIRSQLALEPVTKIELDDSDEDVAIEPTENSASTSDKNQANSKRPEPAKSNSNDKKIEDKNKKVQPKSKTPEVAKSTVNDKRNKSDTAKEPKKSNLRKSPEQNRRVVILREKPRENIPSTSKQPPEPEKPKSVPVKLKRNFRGTELEGYPLSTIAPPPIKEKTPPKNDSRGSSPDVKIIAQNISTYFISDSDEEEQEPPPAKKKSPSPKIIVQSVEIIPPLENNEAESEPKQQNENEQPHQQQKQVMEVTESENQNNSEKPAEEITTTQNESQEKQNFVESPQDDDDDIVNIMSDTEIDLNVNSDKEEEEECSKQSDENEESDKNTQESNEKAVESDKEKQASQQTSDYDDDVVEIHTDDEILDSDKPSDSAKNSDESETWTQRYLRSSNVKSVLQTASLASKVRGKIVQNKKSQKAAKKEKEKEKSESTERVSTHEEGSMGQFHGLKDSSNSNL